MANTRIRSAKARTALRVVPATHGMNEAEKMMKTDELGLKFASPIPIPAIAISNK